MDFKTPSNPGVNTTSQPIFQAIPQQQFPVALQDSSHQTPAGGVNPQLPAFSMSFYRTVEAVPQAESQIGQSMLSNPAIDPVQIPDPTLLDDSRTIPTSKSWERLRPKIRRLYVDENRKLKEVMAILASQDNHQGTVKTYKSRIKKWGFIKNNKEEDMLFLRQKILEYNSIGKKVAFEVRGRVVHPEEADRYFRRRLGMMNNLREGARTPPHITYRSLSAIPATIKPPTELLSLERLFSSLQIYYDGSFSNGRWITNYNTSHYHSITSIAPKQISPHDFYYYCISAATLFRHKLVVQARRMLSRACELVRDLVIAQEPNLVYNIFRSLLYFIKRGIGEVASFMLNYIDNMTRELFMRANSDHPLGNIWFLLKGADLHSLESALVNAFRCVQGRLEHNLGTLHPTTLESSRTSIDTNSDASTRERLMRAHITKCKQARSEMSAVEVMTAMGALGYILIEQRRFSEAETIAMEILEDTHDSIATIMACSLTGQVQFELGKVELAEKNHRIAIQLISEMFHKAHPYAVKMLVELQYWLRYWGRGSDADEVLVEIDWLIGRDEADEVNKEPEF